MKNSLRFLTEQFSFQAWRVLKYVTIMFLNCYKFIPSSLFITNVYIKRFSIGYVEMYQWLWNIKEDKMKADQISWICEYSSYQIKNIQN